MAMFAVGAFAALALLRYACLRIELQDPSSIAARGGKEAPMKFHAVLRSIGETPGSLGGNLAGGLLLS